MCPATWLGWIRRQCKMLRYPGTLFVLLSTGICKRWEQLPAWVHEKSYPSLLSLSLPGAAQTEWTGRHCCCPFKRKLSAGNDTFLTPSSLRLSVRSTRYSVLKALGLWKKSKYSWYKQILKIAISHFSSQVIWHQVMPFTALVFNCTCLLC